MRIADNTCGAVLLGFALLLLLAGTPAAQTPVDESQSAPATGAITGRVSEGGRAVPNASVVVRGLSQSLPPRMTATDNEGNFKVADLNAGLYTVSAFAPGYITLPRDVEAPPSFTRIGDSVDLSLVKGGVITGSVMSATGDPVVQVTVRAILIKDANGEPPRFAQNPLPRPTDDRGFYRIYGLLPGTYLVSAGGRTQFGFSLNAYDGDVPTYAPSSTRDTAAEIPVRAGEETTGVDIRYRGEAGRTVTGRVLGPTDQPGVPAPTINLVQISNGVPLGSSTAVQLPGGRGFTFHGVGDGDYELTAQLYLAPDMMISDPRRITVKGADVTGIELTVKPLASIGGRIILQPSDSPECKNKRRPLLSETLVMARRSEKGPGQSQRPQAYFFSQSSPGKSGEFQLRSLSPGAYNLNTQFFARYWYLRSISRNAPLTGAKAAPPNRQIDAARNQLTLKTGEKVTDLTITLAEGAASLRGTIKLGAEETLPPRLYVHLVTSEKERLEDVLRVFAAEVNSDGTFALNNLPPGRYWVISRVAAENETQLPTRVRTPDETELRSRIRQAAEAGKTSVEFQPCQNVIDYQLSRPRGGTDHQLSSPR